MEERITELRDLHKEHQGMHREQQVLLQEQINGLMDQKSEVQGNWEETTRALAEETKQQASMMAVVGMMHSQQETLQNEVMRVRADSDEKVAVAYAEVAQIQKQFQRILMQQANACADAAIEAYNAEILEKETMRLQSELAAVVLREDEAKLVHQRMFETVSAKNDEHVRWYQAQNERVTSAMVSEAQESEATLKELQHTKQLNEQLTLDLKVLKEKLERDEIIATDALRSVQEQLLEAERGLLREQSKREAVEQKCSLQLDAITREQAEEQNFHRLKQQNLEESLGLQHEKEITRLEANCVAA